MLTVHTFGRFLLTDGIQSLEEGEIRSAKLCNLLTYLLMHRNRTLTVDELTLALWQEEETKNPSGALKNLMYRLRKLLRSTFGEEVFIKTSADTYYWNENMAVTIDAEQMEQLWMEAKKEKPEEGKRQQLLRAAVKLYDGGFMPQISELHWVSALDAYYRSVYHSCVTLLAEEYETQKRYEEMEVLCREALRNETASEDFYYYLILARCRQGKTALAWKTYEDACLILKEEVGITQPKKLQAVYTELSATKKGKMADDIEVVQHGMSEKNPKGVFWCGYSVFREIYRLETRKMRDLGWTEQMILLTVLPGDKKEPEWETVDIYRVKKAMNHLERSLQKVLRSGDAVSRYSDSQYVILLSLRQGESARKVAGKIIAHYYGENPGDTNISVHANLKDVR